MTLKNIKINVTKEGMESLAATAIRAGTTEKYIVLALDYIEQLHKEIARLTKLNKKGQSEIKLSSSENNH